MKEKLGIHFEIPLLGCNLSALRSINAIGLVLLVPLLVAAYRKRNPEAYRNHRVLFEHSALNIALFPPLFFFSALYYTDIWATLSAIIIYTQTINVSRENKRTLLHFIRLVTLGLFSLTFRQTNIFWVAVFPAGIEFVQHIDHGHQAVRDSMRRGVAGFGDSLYSVAKTSWKMQVIYDPPVGDASADGVFADLNMMYEAALTFVPACFKTLISIAACTLKTVSQPRQLFSLVQALAPYITLLALFATFVLWNGSVVLGDKTNHIATLHLPQMLYLWPFITFFSWPMLYPYLLLLPISTIAQLPGLRTLESLHLSKRDRHLLPHLWLAILFLAAACAIVRANTVVHPFTLADNRHYIFYIFRLLLRPWWMRYAVTPIYLLGAWSSIQALGDGPPEVPTTTSRAPRTTLPDAEHPAKASFVLVWLATSALQLITAPLVEPRYFILPWVFWRMHVPLRLPPRQGGRNGVGWSWRGLWEDYDHRLWLETAWLLAVNAVTGYIFLNWGFEWPQEPGKVQRFMW